MRMTTLIRLSSNRSTSASLPHNVGMPW
ncbi:hypothetical protein IEO21_08162 [Rhodonia placenta]|uniref:Uncharacterized protein n=1 Tax=Rhodonia placenta TaxID=104341 RepID=A0A8H7NX35_9APHY|nr:hypothetical protein IEO21_08162 [Postia placenta]